MQLVRSAALLALVSAAVAAHAAPITYTATGLAHGTFNGSGFQNVMVTLVGKGDTKDKDVFFDIDYVPVTATVSVEGLGSGQITSDVYATVDRTNGRASLSSYFSPLLGAQNDAFKNYDVTTAIGPTSGPTTAAGTNGVATTGGLLTISSFSTVTFQASFAPSVPGPVAALPFALIALRRRRNR